MAQFEHNPTTLNIDQIGDAATAITTLASTHGITAEPGPIDTFADAASRLSDAEVAFDHFERLLLKLARAGVVTDDERFALHALYLRQLAISTR